MPALGTRRLRLTLNQATVLMRAAKNMGLADKVPPTYGEALVAKGYGTYYPVARSFRINSAGWRYYSSGEQVGVHYNV